MLSGCAAAGGFEPPLPGAFVNNEIQTPENRSLDSKKGEE